MAVKSFKFISPGIFIDEIDNSQLPAVAAEMGPVIVGRTERGPAMRPVSPSLVVRAAMCGVMETILPQLMLLMLHKHT